MSNPDPNGNIYVTAKSRMVAEARLKTAEMMSQILMAWYSVCIIGLSLLDLSQNYRVRDVSVMTAILSVAVLATSIFLSSRNFSLRAASFRDCYLKMQKIYSSQATPADKSDDYLKILPLFENQLQSDYEWVLFQSWLFGKPLADADGTITVSRLLIAKCIARAMIRWMSMFGLFAFPLVLGYMLVIPR